MSHIRVGILGATGMVGQTYVQLLSDHPWFEVTWLASSSRSAGQRYGDAVAGRWWSPQPPPTREADMIVRSIDELDEAAKSCDLIFSAVGADISAEWEERYAAAGMVVVSNSSHHRHTPDVPIVIPEINSEQLKGLVQQQRARGWKQGFIVTKPNCSLQSFLIPLYPLHLKFKVREVVVTTMQAISGAGYPGPAAGDMVDNVIPHIGGEEAKTEREPLKILGAWHGDVIEPVKDLKITAHCNRVPVLDGHMACVSVRFEHRPSHEQILECWRSFRGLPQELELPSAPDPVIIYREEVDRPQPRLDRQAGNGMAISVGRLRDCPVMHHRFVGLSHNVVRGAAGGAVLIAELLVKNQYLKAQQ